MPELVLKREEGWGYDLAVNLPCGHAVKILEKWVDAEGRFVGRLSCSTHSCRRTFDDVVLEGWQS